MNSPFLQSRPVRFVEEHSLLFGTLLALSVIAGISQWLTSASLVQFIEDPLYRGVIPVQNAAGCTSEGSPFDPEEDSSMKNATKVIEKFHEEVSDVVAEHEYFLKTPSRWKCDAKTFDELMPPSPKLQAMAKKLPGLSKNDKKAGFSSFVPILAEYQRVYECRMLELTEGRIGAVLEGQDTSASSEPGSNAEVIDRATSLTALLVSERHTSRLALERTFNTFRSFELAAPMNIELNCLQREAVDLRNALSLLADTASCMPKIWDAVTSLHEPGP
jgi:hypothetical protein